MNPAMFQVARQPSLVRRLTSHAMAGTVSRLFSRSCERTGVAPPQPKHTFEIESKGSEPPHTFCNSVPA